MTDNGKIKSTLDTLLDGRSDRFKATVLELAHKNGWDDNDPAFTILVATGQMEALLRQYPAEFAVLLTGILEDAEERWASIQQEWIKAVKMASETSAIFEGQVRTLESATEQQISLLGAESEQLLAKGFALSQAHTVKQIEQIAKGTRKTHYLQAIGYSCGLAFLLSGLSWTGGWFGRGLADEASTWGDIERWNQPELKACLSAAQSTCNFHIEKPEEEDARR